MAIPERHSGTKVLIIISFIEVNPRRKKRLGWIVLCSSDAGNSDVHRTRVTLSQDTAYHADPLCREVPPVSQSLELLPDFLRRK